MHESRVWKANVPVFRGCGLGTSAAFRWLALTVLLTVGSSAVGQEAISEQQRSSAKPILESSTRTPSGETFVALAKGLEEVFSGREPTTLSELRALEAQQSRVAKSIEQVTVNVQQGTAQGSGVIITPDGYVLTAAHVAGGANRDAWVILSDGRRVRARTLGMNRDKDAGLLKIIEEHDKPWPHATLGKSSNLELGQWCVAAGHPGGWKPERGAVIRVGRILSIDKRRGEREANTLFTDCALIGGDSGGPLFTLQGELIGIHSRIGTEVVDNMHVPIDVFAKSWDRMVQKEVWGVLPGYQPVIGVVGEKSSDRAIIASVLDNSPAQAAGIVPGDEVLKIDNRKITTFEELRLAVKNSTPGDILTLTVMRDGQVIRLPVTVGFSDE